MKYFRIFLLILLLMADHAGARPRNGLIYRGKQWLIACMDVGVGYIPDHKYERYTVSTAFNNIYSRRFGAFSVVEVDRHNPAVVIGPTVSLTDYAYVYGGIDFLTSRGCFGRHSFVHARKDLGLGVYPVRWATIKVCHSFNSGSRIEIGVRIPLKRDPAAILRIRNRR